MRRVGLVLLGALILQLGAVSAFAGSVDRIIGKASSTTQVRFIGTGGPDGHQFDMVVDLKNVVGTGYGRLRSHGFISLVNAGAHIFSSGSCGAGCFMLGQSGPLKFSYGSTRGSSDLLTGDVFLTNLVQRRRRDGTFRDRLVMNFTVTGGDLASAFADGDGQVLMRITMIADQDLAEILDGQTIFAGVVAWAF